MDAGCAQLVAHGVGGRKVLTCTGIRPRREGESYQCVNGFGEIAGRGRGPLRHRVEAKHGEHAANVEQCPAGSLPVTLSQRIIACPYRLMYDGECGRDGKVVVHGVRERLPGKGIRLARSDVTVEHVARVADESLD